MSSSFKSVMYSLAVSGAFFPLVSEAEALSSVLSQAENLPADFSEHFFNVPLSARVMLNGELLGDALLMLSRDNTVQLIEFTDEGESRLPHADRQRWSGYLNKPVQLGPCKSGCDNGLVAIQYSLTTAELSIITDAASKKGEARYHELPEDGSHGLIMRNQFNFNGGQGQSTSGRYALDASGSIGNWSTVAGMQLDRSGYENAQLNHSIYQLYTQREFNTNFLRVGFFTPDSQGVLRQPRTSGGRAMTTLGVMTGSSDTLLQDSATASYYPIYVTANREGTVEIYRDGVMINSQPIEPGLQLINTEPLPGGIYPVEVRLVEDGRITSNTEELIYKPSLWRNPSKRWLYNVFAGQQDSLWSNNSHQNEGDLAFGGSVNYLFHPRVVGGLALQQIGEQGQVGASVDWQPAESVRVYGNVFHTGDYGNGFDSQASWRYAQGSVTFNHSRTWREIDRDRSGWKTPALQHNTGVSLNHRLNTTNTVTSRVSHTSNNGGLGLDLSWNTRREIFNSPVTVTFAAFDRPYSDNGSQRNRGATLSASFSFGDNKRNVYASLGSRNDNRGGRDNYASVSLDQQIDNGWFKQVSSTLTGDRYGVGMSGYGRFEHQSVQGDLYAQRSSMNGDLSGGINLDNTVVIGAGKIATSNAGITGSGHTGMIIDVESDDPTVRLRADDIHGSSATLRPGRNFVPVTAYKSGQVQYDFHNDDTPELKIHPTTQDYHLNKGGVSHSTVRVMKTVTVLGRVVDHQGKPLGGAKVINHAGRSVSESDGFFSLDLHEGNPTVAIEHQSGVKCEIRLKPEEHRREGDTLLTGNLQCPRLG